MKKELDIQAIASHAKKVALKVPPTQEITDILYKNDEGNKLTTKEINSLLIFTYANQIVWQKPPTSHEMLTEILTKIGHGPRENAKCRYGSNKPMTRKELEVIHAWVMSRKD